MCLYKISGRCSGFYLLGCVGWSGGKLLPQMLKLPPLNNSIEKALACQCTLMNIDVVGLRHSNIFLGEGPSPLPRAHFPFTISTPSPPKNLLLDRTLVFGVLIRVR